jgi:superfamily II DNA or RNA helicase
MSSLLREHQFSEEFLIETILYYDSWKCLRTQNNLSPYFCFRYLYDNDTDSADDWTDYNQIKDYLLKRAYTIGEIEYWHSFVSREVANIE